MKKTSTFEKALVIHRGILGTIMISHGVARIYYGSITDFGLFLNSMGSVVGVPLACLITLLDVVFGLLLLLGKTVRLVAVWFLCILTMGIVLVHFQNGWFVVGHGQNGIEYNVLLISCFVLLMAHTAAPNGE